MAAISTGIIHTLVPTIAKPAFSADPAAIRANIMVPVAVVVGYSGACIARQRGSCNYAYVLSLRVTGAGVPLVCGRWRTTGVLVRMLSVEAHKSIILVKPQTWSRQNQNNEIETLE